MSPMHCTLNHYDKESDQYRTNIGPNRSSRKIVQESDSYFSFPDPDNDFEPFNSYSETGVIAGGEWTRLPCPEQQSCRLLGA